MHLVSLTRYNSEYNQVTARNLAVDVAATGLMGARDVTLYHIVIRVTP